MVNIGEKHNVQNSNAGKVNNQVKATPVPSPILSSGRINNEFVKANVLSLANQNLGLNMHITTNSKYHKGDKFNSQNCTVDINFYTDSDTGKLTVAGAALLKEATSMYDKANPSKKYSDYKSLKIVLSNPVMINENPLAKTQSFTVVLSKGIFCSNYRSYESFSAYSVIEQLNEMDTKWLFGYDKAEFTDNEVVTIATSLYLAGVFSKAQLEKGISKDEIVTAINVIQEKAEIPNNDSGNKVGPGTKKEIIRMINENLNKK